jgi:hypothetical protein
MHIDETRDRFLTHDPIDERKSLDGLYHAADAYELQVRRIVDETKYLPDIFVD